MRIYIAGKITGLSFDEVVRDFARAEQELVLCGQTPVNPIREVDQSPGRKYEDCLRDALNVLLTCEAIYLLPNWKESEGAKLEKSIADSLKMRVLTHGFAGRKVFSKPEEWIECQADGCPEKFIQTDPEAEVDLCPPCEAALMRVAA